MGCAAPGGFFADAQNDTQFDITAGEMTDAQAAGTKSKPCALAKSSD